MQHGRAGGSRPWGFRGPFYGSHEWVFNQALGGLRGTFGIHVAMLSSKFGIDVEDDLATILSEAELDFGRMPTCPSDLVGGADVNPPPFINTTFSGVSCQTNGRKRPRKSCSPSG
jgi:hypothetical protein